MKPNWYRRFVRVTAGTVASAAVIGGAMGMSAAAHANNAASAPTAVCAVATR
jgi:hypothetical protein